MVGAAAVGLVRALGEVMGLAQAARKSTGKVIKMVDDDEGERKGNVTDTWAGSLKLAAQEDPGETE